MPPEHVRLGGSAPACLAILERHETLRPLPAPRASRTRLDRGLRVSQNTRKRLDCCLRVHRKYRNIMDGILIITRNHQYITEVLHAHSKKPCNRVHCGLRARRNPRTRRDLSAACGGLRVTGLPPCHPELAYAAARLSDERETSARGARVQALHRGGRRASGARATDGACGAPHPHAGVFQAHGSHCWLCPCLTYHSNPASSLP